MEDNVELIKLLFNIYRRTRNVEKGRRGTEVGGGGGEKKARMRRIALQYRFSIFT